MASEAAKLLDELMGRDRNVDPSEARREVRWEDNDVSNRCCLSRGKREDVRLDPFCRQFTTPNVKHRTTCGVT